MSSGAHEASTYPDSWADLPGTRTQKPSPEHPNAVEQSYTLDDGGATANPVKKGKHKRETLSGAPTPPDNLMPKN